MAERKYYWLKLKDDFFTSKRIKKLRGMAGGDTYLIIYLKMQLLSIKSGGVLQWTGLEEKFADELALDIDEKPDDVAVTLMYLLNTGLAETSDNINFFLPYAVENTGSETSAAKRMRDMRERNNLSERNIVTPVLLNRYGEKEIDTRDRVREKKEFVPPTIEEVRSYCQERNSSVDPQKFYDYYSTGQWKDSKGNPVKNWKQKLITWERKDDGRNINSGNAEKRPEQWNIHYD